MINISLIRKLIVVFKGPFPYQFLTYLQPDQNLEGFKVHAKFNGEKIRITGKMVSVNIVNILLRFY